LEADYRRLRAQNERLLEALHQTVAAMWSGDSAEKGRAGALAREVIAEVEA
jgi:hypothetical protein